MELSKDDILTEIDELKPEKPRRKRRGWLIPIIMLLLAALTFTVIQSGMKYTARSSYMVGYTCCKNIWLKAEEISESEGITLEGEMTPESPMGQKIAAAIDDYGGKVKDFRVCCQKGKILYVVCNMYGRKLEMSDIRFHTRDEQINSLSSVFTRRKTIACVTDADMKTVFDD